MIGDILTFVLTNMPPILFVAALLGAYLARNPFSAPERTLAWLLLLSVGIDGIWAGTFHIFFPGTASGQIGWARSPFEFEVGVADLAMGIVAVIAFWRSLSFQSAIALFAILFYAGAAVGHFVQAIAHDNFAPNNFGIMLVITLLRVLVLSWLLWTIWLRPDRRVSA